MRPNSLRQWLPALLLATLLVVLATLQYRWIGAVSLAEQVSLKKSIERSAIAAGQTFDDEISRLLFSVGLAPHEQLTTSLANWREESQAPKLLQEVLWIRIPPFKQDPREPSKPQPIIERLNEATGNFEVTEWTSARRHLVRFLKLDRRGPDQFRDTFGDVEPTLPALVVRAGRARRRPMGRQTRGILALVLDREILERRVHEVLFPQLNETLGDQFAFRVLDHDGQKIAANAEPWPTVDRSLRFPLLRPRPPTNVRRQFVQRLLNRYRTQGRPLPPWASQVEGGEEGEKGRESLASFGPPGIWSLHIVHREGTLEQAVRQTRLRNLGISGAILGLLAATVAYLLRSAKRDRQLAERQLDFVAGLTHELHTPLAAITSAGANLADGVVAEPKRVREYGEMLKKEGGRLNDLVGQALHLAGIESSKPEAPRENLDVTFLLEEAIDRCQLMAKEADARITLETLDRPVSVLGDREGLLQALTNLLTNAVKHGASEVTVATTTKQRAGRRVVIIRIADNGPGIDERDRIHLFEAFARGRANSRTNQGSTPGAGLGLYLARRITERHGGKLRFIAPATDQVASDKGAVFELSLPMVAP